MTDTVNELAGDAALPFVLTARGAQCAPAGDWNSWLALGGRGSGKTRAGAEWVRFGALFGGLRSIALVGPTLHDVRETMIDGVSGLCQIARPGEAPPVYESSRRRLVWPNGAVAQAFSSEDPDSLRGPQFDGAWCDEVAAWKRDKDTFEMLQLGLRLGRHPRAVITTTPRRTPLIRQLMSEGGVAVTRSATRDNADFLSPAFISHIEARMGGTRLGRQELEGEFLEAEDGVFWTRAMLLAARAGRPPSKLSDIIVAVDPPVSIGEGADACGLIAAGATNAAGGGVHFWVLEDATLQGKSPAVWAEAAVTLAVRMGASRIVAEANQGGELVRSVLRSGGCDVPIQLVHARLSKTARAAPVIALYERGRVSHAGQFAELEEEMLQFGSSGMQGSPDRVDALVWAITTLETATGRQPSIRQLW
jgi:phage terminase large subunit-like protein